jgi:hypothetical protein
VVEEIGGKIAMGVNEAYPMTGLDILENKIPKKCRLAAASLSDDIGVIPTVGRKKTEGQFSAPDVAHAKLREFVLIHDRRPNHHSRQRKRRSGISVIRWVLDFPGMQSEKQARVERHTLWSTSRRGNGGLSGNPTAVANELP